MKDHSEKIDQLTDELMASFLEAADPAAWSGAGMAPALLDEKQRGARNWDVKNANQIGALAARALQLREALAGRTGGAGETPDDEAAADIARFEKAAKAARAALEKAGKAVNGKA
jgi:hypothetical protein